MHNILTRIVPHLWIHQYPPADCWSKPTHFCAQIETKPSDSSSTASSAAIVSSTSPSPVEEHSATCRKRHSPCAGVGAPMTAADVASSSMLPTPHPPRVRLSASAQMPDDARWWPSFVWVLRLRACTVVDNSSVTTKRSCHLLQRFSPDVVVLTEQGSAASKLVGASQRYRGQGIPHLYTGLFRQPALQAYSIIVR